MVKILIIGSGNRDQNPGSTSAKAVQMHTNATHQSALVPHTNDAYTDAHTLAYTPPCWVIMMTMTAKECAERKTIMLVARTTGEQITIQADCRNSFSACIMY